MDDTRDLTEPKFLIVTAMEKEDYRQFLYISTFLKNSFTIPGLAVFAMLGSMLINFSFDSFSLLRSLLTGCLMFAFIIGVLIFKIQMRFKQRVSTDNTGTFGSSSTLMFYEDKVIIVNKAFNSHGELEYNKFYKLIESNDFFLFYLTGNQASFIRKKDIANEQEFKAFILDKFKGRYKCI